MTMPYDVAYSRALVVARSQYANVTERERRSFATRVAYLVTGLRQSWTRPDSADDFTAEGSLLNYVGRVSFEHAIQMSAVTGNYLRH